MSCQRSSSELPCPPSGQILEGIELTSVAPRRRGGSVGRLDMGVTAIRPPCPCQHQCWKHRYSSHFYGAPFSTRITVLSCQLARNLRLIPCLCHIFAPCEIIFFAAAIMFCAPVVYVAIGLKTGASSTPSMLFPEVSCALGIRCFLSNVLSSRVSSLVFPLCVWFSSVVPPPC